MGHGGHSEAQSSTAAGGVHSAHWWLTRLGWCTPVYLGCTQSCKRMHGTQALVLTAACIALLLVARRLVRGLAARIIVSLSLCVCGCCIHACIGTKWEGCKPRHRHAAGRLCGLSLERCVWPAKLPSLNTCACVCAQVTQQRVHNVL